MPLFKCCFFILYYCLIYLSGHHECEILGTGLEATESAYAWKECKKNPGHEEFISAKDFIQKNRRPSLNIRAKGKKLQSLLDLTVRLRVLRTSQGRPNDDALSRYRGSFRVRVGTGFIHHISGPEYNKPCPCVGCDGKVTKKYWTFHVATAHHVVYNTEEAKETRVDLFYEDENCLLDGRLKTVTGLKVEYTKPDKDFCTMLCVTHDETLGKQIKTAFHCLNDMEESFQNLLSPYVTKNEGALIVSHPHGQAKKITVGKIRYNDKKGSIVRYSTATCPGSSGAPVFMSLGCTFLFNIFHYVISLHSGTCPKTSRVHMDQLPKIFKVFEKWGIDLILPQLNSGNKWMIRSNKKGPRFKGLESHSLLSFDQ